MQPKTVLFDAAVAIQAVTSPLWLHWLNIGLQEVALVGGALLVALRVASAALELWRKLKGKG